MTSSALTHEVTSESMISFFLGGESSVNESTIVECIKNQEKYDKLMD